MAQCDGCTIVEDSALCGEALKPYRGQMLCYSCIALWQTYEEKLARTVEFQEFRKGLDISKVARLLGQLRLKAKSEAERGALAPL